ncbi:uncharacterized protein DSM5745_04492 [Aspergillus mulundensis]|uniref:Uncharacterized protein n=1 Tax=Aspergillus mulundensis TaxID=1810919 RepID=A0A3D8SCU8_9EURO|nr:hypothetical protein DSM5745_04492 [Aspergillus mulundensis]RDW84166.1 hypothetical protein DSM5745_04492 [Aspergillus mulundensis]
MASQGNRWLYLFIHRTATESEPHQWTFVCPPTRFRGSTEASCLYIHNSGPSAGPGPQLVVEEGTQILRRPRRPWHTYSSIHRICWYPADVHFDIVELLLRSVRQANEDGAMERRWQGPFLRELVEWEFVEQWEADTLDALWFTRPVADEDRGPVGAGGVALEYVDLNASLERNLREQEGSARDAEERGR